MTDKQPDKREELRSNILVLLNSDTTYLIPEGIDTSEWYADTIMGQVDAYLQGEVERADREAMLREATHRANDALDRLLRLDRGHTVGYLEEYLGNLRLVAHPKTSKQEPKDHED